MSQKQESAGSWPAAAVAGWGSWEDTRVNIFANRLESPRLRRHARFAGSILWLRGVGWLTRPVIYLGPVVLLVWWLWPYFLFFSQSLDSLTIIDFLLIGGCMTGLFGIALGEALFVFNVGGGEIDWEAWGCVGCGLIAATIPLWAAFWGLPS